MNYSRRSKVLNDSQTIIQDFDFPNPLATNRDLLLVQLFPSSVCKWEDDLAIKLQNQGGCYEAVSKLQAWFKLVNLDVCNNLRF